MSSTVLSPVLAAIIELSGENAMAGYSFAPVANEDFSFCVARSHTLTVPSGRPAETSHLPSGEKATCATECAWPAKLQSRRWSAAFQIRIVGSSPAAATFDPSGEKATVLFPALAGNRAVTRLEATSHRLTN